MAAMPDLQGGFSLAYPRDPVRGKVGKMEAQFPSFSCWKHRFCRVIYAICATVDAHLRRGSQEFFSGVCPRWVMWAAVKGGVEGKNVSKRCHSTCQYASEGLPKSVKQKS